MAQSLLTICIPVYNGKRFLDRVVRSCSLGEYSNLGVLVVDNASDDGTDEVCESLSEEFENFTFVRYEDHVDAISNWNRCIEICQTDYLCYVCCDDLVLPGGLSGAVGFLLENTNLSFLCCSVLGVSPEGGFFRQDPSGDQQRIMSKGKSELQKHELIAEGVSVSGLIMKRSALLKVGKLSHEFELITEFILPQLLVKTGDFAVLEFETGLFIPRRGSHYNRNLSDRVVRDITNGFRALAERAPVAAGSASVARSFAITILRNVADRGPISVKQSVCILRNYRNFFGSISSKLAIGLLGFSILRFRGKLFDRITHFFRRKKYILESDLSEQTLLHIDEVCPEILGKGSRDF